MSATLKEDYSTLVRYFLGELWEDEQDLVEERYMLDENFSELRYQVELDLVDAYMADTLTRQQRQNFETNYLVTAERRDTVRVAWVAKVYRKRVPQPAEAVAPHLWARIQRWLFNGGRLVPSLAAAAALAAGVGGTYIAVKVHQAHQQAAARILRKVNPPPIEKPPEVAVVTPLEPAAPGAAPPAAVSPAPPPTDQIAGGTSAPLPIPPPAAVLPPPTPPIEASPSMPVAGVAGRPVPGLAGSVTIPAGTDIVVRTIDAIDTKNSNSYTEYHASLDDAIVLNGATIVPKGAPAVLRATEIKQPGKIKGKASVTLHVVALNVNGQRVNLETGGFTSSGNSKAKTTAESAGAGAVVGAEVGAITGGAVGAGVGAAVGATAGTTTSMLLARNIKIPPETRLTFKLLESVVTGAAAANPINIDLLGMTSEQVINILGKPSTTFEAGPKLIYVYPNIKVTFIDGKVVNAQ
jgi:hypothetical protein